MDKKEIIKNYCSNCQNENNHSVLFSKVVSDYELAFGVSIEIRYETVECMGCENITFLKVEFDYTGPPNSSDGTYRSVVASYPNSLKNHKLIDDYHLLPKNIRVVYFETLEAIKAKCFLLAGVGFRAIIEAICLEKSILGKDLKTKIAELLFKKLITKKEEERLHAVRFLGNEAVHQIAVPEERDLMIVLKITEHLLDNLYIIDTKTVLLKKEPISKPQIKLTTTYEYFEKLLIESLKFFKQNDEFRLGHFIDKLDKSDKKRLKDNLVNFEEELKNKINAGDFALLKIGKTQPSKNEPFKNIQFFIVNN